MKRLIASIVLVGFLGAARANDVPEFRALQQKDGVGGVEAINKPQFVKTHLIPGLGIGFTNAGAPFQIMSIEARRGGSLASTNVMTITRTRTVVYDSVTSSWTDILVLQGWTNVITPIIDPAPFVIDTGDICFITNTVTNVNVTINAGKR